VEGLTGGLIESLKGQSRLISQLDSSAKDLNIDQVVSSLKSAVEAPSARYRSRGRFTRPFVVEPITFKLSIVSRRHGTNPTTKKIQRTILNMFYYNFQVRRELTCI